MKNSFQNYVERLSKVEADLEEARSMLNFSILERVRLEKEADWIAENADSCPPGLTYDIECLKDKGLSCKDCWRKKALEATAE